MRRITVFEESLNMVGEIMINLNEIPAVTILNFRESINFEQMIAYPQMGDFFLIRKQGNNYGVISIGVKNPHNSRIIPIIRFDEPFNEAIKNYKSSKVPNLTVLPYLAQRYINLFKSGYSWNIAKDYLKRILKEKRAECIFENFQCPNIITDDIVTLFLNRLERYRQDL